MRPLRLPSLKHLLIQINLDLDALAACIKRHGIDTEYPFHIMVLLLEDRRYSSHLGIDYRSFVRDFWRLLTFRRHGGFSTIEMQFVRTITGRYERTLRRKIYEILLAHLCNWHFEKFPLLNSYLAVAYYGASYPVGNECTFMPNYEQVANDVFGKAIDNLTLQESAEIAAYLVYPLPAHPYNNWRQRMIRRRDYALRLYARREQILK